MCKKNWLQAFVGLKNVAEVEEFFEDMFTKDERKTFSERWEVVSALIKGGKTQRQLASELKISLARVNHGNKQIKNGSGGFKNRFEALNKLKKK